jgi:hypothetical protein
MLLFSIVRSKEMPKKATIKTTKSLSSKSPRETTQSGDSSSNGSSKKYVHRDSSTGKFVATKTGRVVKSSPVEPRLGRERIQTAVKGYISRDDRTRRLSD